MIQETPELYRDMADAFMQAAAEETDARGAASLRSAAAECIRRAVELRGA